MHVFQVGVGSGGMPVLDLLVRDSRVTRVTLIDPDTFKPHNAVRHPFPPSAVGRLKVDVAADWLEDRRPDLPVETLPLDLLAPEHHQQFLALATTADLGVCAADGEPAKFGFDAIMRHAGKPWTLGEVLSGGIGGFVHWFRPGGPCYGCVASHLQRTVTEVPAGPAPDYSNPGGAVAETTVPAGIAPIHVIAGLHAMISLDLLAAGDQYEPGFTSLLMPLQRVPGVFEEAFRAFRFRVPRSAACLTCRPEASSPGGSAAPEDLDVALDQALARLGNE